jgi:UDP-N-acetylmuramate dehydrogenase
MITPDRFVDAMRTALGAGRLRANVPLAPFTTFRTGGPAEWLFESMGSDEIVAALKMADREGIPVTLLGGGSNVLVADEGVSGLVIRPRGGAARYANPGIVRADAGLTINGLVRWTITRALGGLEAWAGTPGTVGGAIFGNAHFGGRLIGELVESVRTATRTGDVHAVPAAAMSFGYDRSRLQDSGEVLLTADFIVTSGDAAALRATARESLAFRKRTQPLDSRSAGCIFQNPQPGRDRVPEGMPWSAGALVDRAGLKGALTGGARVSPTHANFIVNDGTATSAEIRLLIRQCQAAVRERFGVELREEIVYIGNWGPETGGPQTNHVHAAH